MGAVPPALRDLPEYSTPISDDIHAFSAEDALAVNEKYRDPAVWENLERDDRFFVIGASASGDHWLLGPDGGVWFFDHNYGERAAHHFEPLQITVTEWLVLGHALARFEKIDDPGDDDVMRLDMLLEAISPGLAERYPLELPFS